MTRRRPAPGPFNNATRGASAAADSAVTWDGFRQKAAVARGKTLNAHHTTLPVFDHLLFVNVRPSESGAIGNCKGSINRQ